LAFVSKGSRIHNTRGFFVPQTRKKEKNWVFSQGAGKSLWKGVFPSYNIRQPVQKTKVLIWGGGGKARPYTHP